jgi:hypothetical protein
MDMALIPRFILKHRFYCGARQVPKLAMADRRKSRLVKDSDDEEYIFDMRVMLPNLTVCSYIRVRVSCSDADSFRGF